MSTLGIELGSTRIKAVIIDDHRKVTASGSHTWENKLVNGLWSYSLEDVWTGMKDSVSDLDLSDISALGISAMMHGYLVFDKNENLLTPFRTWRCVNTGAAAEKLTKLFDFNIPLRWSAAHLYQAILNGEEHVKDIAFITTLAGYVHWKLTGEKVIGIGDASGMFPVKGGNWNSEFVRKFEQLTGINWADIAPKVLLSGEYAGKTIKNNLLHLPENIPLCPPEGDAGTGMCATNAVAPRTANVSAGTSIFAMVVLEKALSQVYPEIDIVTTPDGKDVAMAHYNECTVKIDPIIKVFAEAFHLFGFDVKKGELYEKLYEIALTDSDLGKFMRGVLESAVSDLTDGMKILTEKENVKIDKVSGHGGFFKSGNAGKTIMSEMLKIPVEISETAAEGGAWGIALLADYVKCAGGKPLGEYLSEVFANV